MRKVLGIVMIVFALAWAAALGLYLVGNFGWFGVETDPLSAVYLLPLGLPWVVALGLFPEPLWPWLGALCPGITLVILGVIRHRIART